MTRGHGGSAAQGREESPVGPSLRAARTAQALSLKRLAASAGVSVGMISQIERGVANPSIRILERLRIALGVPMSALLEPPASQAALVLHPVGEAAGPARGPAPATPGFVRRACDRPQFHAAGSVPILKELLSPADAEGLRLMILNVPPGAEITEVLLAPGIKAGLMLSGSAAITVGAETTVVDEGDSFQFDSSVTHAIRSTCAQVTRILWIISAVPAAQI